jgi:predicted nucleic acid-binding protein
MKFYLDASILVSIVSEESSSDRVHDLLRLSDQLPVITDFCHAESSAALSKLVRLRARSPEDVDGLLAQLDYWAAEFGDRPAIVTEDVADAAQLVRRHDLSLRAPDAIHIAAADRLNATLLTLDLGMAKAAAALGVPHFNPAEA